MGHLSTITTVVLVVKRDCEYAENVEGGGDVLARKTGSLSANVDPSPSLPELSICEQN